MSGEVSSLPSGARELADSLSATRWGPYSQPRFDGYSLPNLSASLFRAVGGKASPESLLPDLASIYPVPNGATTAIVFLIDAFGWKLFTELLAIARSSTERVVMNGLVPHTLPITTVFPTTTSSALLSLSTATSPGRHGIVGYTEYFPEWGSILNTLKMTPSWGGPRDLAAGRNLKPEDLIPTPTLFRRGLASIALTKSEFDGTAFTRMLYDGASLQGYLSLSDLALHLSRILSKPSYERPSLLWIYWDVLDSVHHANGPLKELAMREITHLFLTLFSVASSLGKEKRAGVSLSVTGDHGQVEANPGMALAAHDQPLLLSLLRRPPSGERRAAFLEAKSGKREALSDYLSAHFPDGWSFFPVDEIIEGGLLGPEPHHPDLKGRLGDFLLLPPPGAAFYYRPPGWRGGEERFLHGAHGGLTEEELLVPLVSLQMEELAGWDL